MSDGHLGKLIGGIQTAICEAHHIAQLQHVIELQRHMEVGSDGKPTDKPKMLRMVVPDNGALLTIDVPEISVVPPKSIAIEHVKVKMKVLLDLDPVQKAESKEKRGWRLLPKFLGGKNDERRDDAVEIEVDFCGCDPPEGYMKAREALDATIRPKAEPNKK